MLVNNITCKSLLNRMHACNEMLKFELELNTLEAHHRLAPSEGQKEKRKKEESQCGKTLP